MITINLLNAPASIIKDGIIYHWSHTNYDGSHQVFISSRNQWLLVPIQ